VGNPGPVMQRCHHPQHVNIRDCHDNIRAVDNRPLSVMVCPNDTVRTIAWSQKFVHEVANPQPVGIGLQLLSSFGKGTVCHGIMGMVVQPRQLCQLCCQVVMSVAANDAAAVWRKQNTLSANRQLRRFVAQSHNHPLHSVVKTYQMSGRSFIIQQIS